MGIDFTTRLKDLLIIISVPSTTEIQLSPLDFIAASFITKPIVYEIIGPGNLCCRASDEVLSVDAKGCRETETGQKLFGTP